MLHLRSRNDFSGRYPSVVKALAKLPDNTVIDDEVVAFDEEGVRRSTCSRNYGSAPALCMDGLRSSQKPN
jgi:hypothetical protein